MTRGFDSGAGTVLLPERYQILPHSLAFRIPGFLKQARRDDQVLAPDACDCEQWFVDFADRVCASVGHEFLPVCRMSDGEFFFLFGQQPPNLRLSLPVRLRRGIRQSLGGLRRVVRGFHASTAPGVSSGEFTPAEWRKYCTILSRDYLTVLEKGILAIHLSFGRKPFQEHYFPALGRWLADSEHRLTTSNYVPFYFVYALLRGPRVRALLTGRRLLVVHSAVNAKRDAITRALSTYAPRSIEWLTISPNRSFADTLEVRSIADSPDICLIGAGIGKARILMQLEPLHVPCIDAGYCFEVWADSERQWDRPYMTPDEHLDVAKVRFLSVEDRASLGAL